MTVAELGIRVTSDADRATLELNSLTAASGKAEAAAKALSGKTTEAANAAKSLTASAQAEAAALTRAGNAARQAANANEQFTRSLQNTKFATANVAAQLNDIGVQLASGTSPFLVAIQQGTQLNQVFGQSGARGAITALGGAFLSLLNPVSLATIAIIGAGGAAIQYFTSLISDGEKSAEELKRQASLVKDIADRWGEAVPAIKAYVDELNRARDAADLIEGGELVAGARYDAIRQQVQDLNVSVADMVTTLSGFGDQAVADTARLQDAFANLQAKVADNTATAEDARAVQQALNDVMAKYGLPAADSLAGAFGGLAEKLMGVSAAAQQARADVAALLAAQKLGRLGTIPPVYSSGGKFINEDELQTVRANATKSQFLIEQERAARSAGRALREAAANAIDPWEDLRKVSDGVKEEMRNLQRQAKMTADAWNRFGEGGVDILTGLATGTMSWKDALQQAIPLVEQLIMNLIKAQQIGGGSGGGGWLSWLFGAGGGLNVFPGGGGVNSTGGLYANGGAFDRGNVIPFARGGIVSRPTMFPMANGAGLMGEAGPEGILPLRRNSQGQLGVMAGGGAANQNVASPMQFTYAPSYNVTGTTEDIDRLRQQMAKDRHEFEAKTVAAVRKAQKTRAL
ncbi:phage tail length tape measure family protein [Mesorhizobium sp. BE184]|uniref:phage tail length tape measure family protein n=1 Tax=Mesorhizobium sp. BE184 TaxID=2817714 RepID=UPI0028669C95|nr:phage tail length tape measure family protein [Mesorhizobium sp. BE184]MDR7032931.1 phage-related minor tail protein [Mesorhizobium sp. BE184]